MRNKHRIISLFLAVLMLLSSTRFFDFVLPVAAVDTAAESITIRDDALHFIIRHWHTGFDSDATQQKEEAQKDGDDWFVVVEGYIVKLREGDDGFHDEVNGHVRNFRILLVNQETGELVLASTQTSPYITAFDIEEGLLTLAVKPIREANRHSATGYDDLEKFCGISLSAGRGAVKYNEDADGNTTGITIAYSGNTHLVKGHVFYNSWSKTVPGTSDEAVFDPDDPYFKEMDVAEVYLWAQEYNDDYTAGTIVKYQDPEHADAEIACKTKEDLANAASVIGGIDASNKTEIEAFINTYFSAETTKFYSTNLGLHTNKTLVQADDSGRLFLADLEAWYVDGYAANIGFILDASGSMAFISDPPSRINVYSALANRLDMTQNGDSTYTYTSKNRGISYSSSPNEPLGDFLLRLADKEHLLDEFLATISDKICRTFTEAHWDALFEKIGILGKTDLNQQVKTYVYPQHDKLIGYYEVYDGKKGTGTYVNHRTWFFNSVTSKDSNGNIYRNPENYSENYGAASKSDFAKIIWTVGQGAFDFGDVSKQQTLITYQDGKDQNDKAFETWGASFPLNFSATQGINLRHANVGILPNAMPSGNHFTLSFALQNGKDSSASFNEPIEILYVGPASGNTSENNFFSVTREGDALMFYNGHSQNGNAVYSIGNLFGTAGSANTTKYTLSLSFDGNKVSVYLDGVKKKEIANLQIGGSTIVFSPFDDYYQGTDTNDPKFWLDDIFIYDATLDEDEVAQLIASYKNDAKAIDGTKTSSAWDEVFILNPTVLSVLLNPSNTAHTQLGVAAYNYFVYDAYDPHSDTQVATKEYAPLAYWDGTVEPIDGVDAAKAGESTLGKASQYIKGNAAGWYYLTHSQDAGEIGKLGTAKRLFGLGDDPARDYVDLPGYERGQTTKAEDPAGTGKIYTPEKGAAVRFYLDGNGDLRCFFSRGASSSDEDVACSYVYELDDSQYVKTESLQRVLANFSTKLSERSPTSLVSAVKFSAQNPNLEELILLDWTSDDQEIAGIMSQKRGKDSGIGTEGTAAGYDISANNVKQYNYVLTGGTYAATGLEAFKTHLATDTRLNPDAPKFLVLFTDGVLQGDEKTTKGLADSLKQAGYTIITVYLPCGPAVNEKGELDETNEEYLKAREKLIELAGSSEGGSGEDYFFAANDVKTLSQIFEDEILAQIVDTMDGYTVQDYIDPRFDLQSADGTVWHLNAGGKVAKMSEDGTLLETIDVTENDPNTGAPYVFRLSGETTPDARRPHLRFDAGNDMYYLEWQEQTLPSAPIGSTSLLPVWNAELLLRAKDDFIGGNAILTNGNAEKMNWVFHPVDSDDAAVSAAALEKMREQLREDYLEIHPSASQEAIDRYIDQNLKVPGHDASSGTGDMYKAYASNGDPEDEFPSKGFPRTTANVRLLPIQTKPIYDVIYMGEAISPTQMLLEIQGEYITDSYYMDYLKRYAYQRYVKESDPAKRAEMDMPLLDLLSLWLEIENDEVFEKEFSLPYMYLPQVEYNALTGKVDVNSSKTNNTGGANTHEQDVVGILTYRWEQLKPAPDKTAADPDYNSAIKDFVKADVAQVQYSLTVEFTPLRVGDTLVGLNGAVDGERPNGEMEMFARYVPLDSSVLEGGALKASFGENYLFDRLRYINGTDGAPAGIRTLALTDEGYRLVTEDAYRWNRAYKPEAADVQTNGEKQPGEDGYPYGDAMFLNGGRTLTARSAYTKDVVGGGVALELKLLIGELKEAKKAGIFNNSFTLTATRRFTDTDFIEQLKQTKYSAGGWDDFGETFTFTFRFDPDSYTAPDENGYVSIFTKTESITATFGVDEQGNPKSVNLAELPIGTYEFDLQEINDKLKSVVKDKLHFASAGYEADETKFQTGHFAHSVLEGLGTDDPEIDQNNIGAYIAGAGMNDGMVTFYVGTDPSAPKRGAASGSDYYIDDRLAMLLLATGSTRLTIREQGADDGETFIYHVIGTTLGEKPVDFYVSVPSNGQTTIEILPGNYTVEECANWAWKYDNLATWGGLTKGADNEGWVIASLTEAKNTLRYREDNPVGEHKTVTFEHKRNTNTVTKEAHADNLFRPSSASN